MTTDFELIRQVFIDFSYIGASVLFILGLKGLSHPESARRGMHLAEIGMLLAIIGTLLYKEVVDFQSVLIGIVTGSAIGIVIALWTPMTAMPQRTAFSHALGALAVTLVGVAEYHHYGAELGTLKTVATGLEVLFGSLTVTGSLMAMGKLQGVIKGTPITFRGQNILNVMTFGVMLALMLFLVFHANQALVFYTLLSLGFLFGVMLVLPIGAADMPVVISLLNSYAGLAASATGFALGNNILIIGGALDGASGFVLSIIMCRAMNRSITNVLFGAFGKAVPTENALPEGATQATVRVKPISVSQAASSLRAAKSVIIVPGYGMAVAQAQHETRDLAELLKVHGARVRYAIHPVAGRMPGHMNVLLAEANVPYNELIDLEEINPEFHQTDLVLVIGANDITNPAAHTNKNSPLYGMPILEVSKAKKVIVIKRSLNPGFSGVENELYLVPNAFLLFKDAKVAMRELAIAFQDARAENVSTSAIAPSGVKSLTPQNAADIFRKAQSVIIVPGYGMATSQAQHSVRDLADVLKNKGAHVCYAIHPVAGRMPGHMNVLLAEANVPYNEMMDLDEVNPKFPQADLALVVGANDITNPAARNNKGSPIYGMPILDVDKAKSVLVVKRSMNTGFAGIENELYGRENTQMIFGDARTVINQVVQELKESSSN